MILSNMHRPLPYHLPSTHSQWWISPQDTEARSLICADGPYIIYTYVEIHLLGTTFVHILDQSLRTDTTPLVYLCHNHRAYP
jgi:hypothetical protein